MSCGRESRTDLGQRHRDHLRGPCCEGHPAAQSQRLWPGLCQECRELTPRPSGVQAEPGTFHWAPSAAALLPTPEPSPRSSHTPPASPEFNHRKQEGRRNLHPPPRKDAKMEGRSTPLHSFPEDARHSWTSAATQVV